MAFKILQDDAFLSGIKEIIAKAVSAGLEPALAAQEQASRIRYGEMSEKFASIVRMRSLILIFLNNDCLFVYEWTFP